MRVQVGEKAEVTTEISDSIVRSFADLSGDHNPIHLRDEFAKNTPFGRRIAHGMISGALISAAIANRLPGPGTIYLGQSLKFCSPIFLGEKVTVALEVLSVRADKPIAVIDTKVYAGSDRRLVVEGEATVKFTP